MEDRLEFLRKKIDMLIITAPPEKVGTLFAHIYGVSKFCTLLAIKRGLNPDIAATCGMLHDVFYMIDITGTDHAEKGAVLAEEILKNLGSYTEDEIKIITTAIKNHSEKRTVHGEYDELLKDADVMDHCFYNYFFPIANWEFARYNSLLNELGAEN